MAYTDQEKQAAIEKLVRTSIRRQLGTLGNREVGVTFNDYQDAAAGVFILYQDAPFYLVSLACARLREALAAERESIDELAATARACDRRVMPIKNLGPLANAREALDGLLLASSTRTSSFSSIESVPAYQRFDSNTQRFLEESSRNIKSGGDIVRTPEEAKALLAPQYDNVKSQHEDVRRRAALLAGAISDLESMNLPKTLSNAILENARTSLSGWYDTMAKLTEKQRLSVIRQATLDILAARSTVRGFSSLSSPTLFVPLEGSGSVYADATHPATPASVSSTRLGPYAILDDATFLHFELEGDPTVIEVQGAFVAAAEGTVYAPFQIGKGATSHPDNDEFRVRLGNRTSWGSLDTFDVNFGDIDTTYQAWEAAGTINYFIPVAPTNYPLIAEPYAMPLKYSGPVDIEWVSGGDYKMTSILLTGNDFTTLGLMDGGYILVTDPNSINHNSVWEIGHVSTPPPYIDPMVLRCMLVFHPDGLSGAAVNEVGPSGGKEIRVTDDKLPVRIRITRTGDKAIRRDPVSLTWTHDAKPDARQSALDNKMSILFPQEGVSGDKDLQLYSTTVLGFFPGSEIMSRRVPASIIASNVTSSPQASIDGVARVEAETYFRATAYEGRGRTDPYNYLQVVASLFEAKNLVATFVGGFVWSFNAVGAATAGVEVGHILAIRATADPSDIGKWGVVSLVTDSEVRLSFTGGIASPTSVDIEIGPDLRVPTELNHDATVTISGSLMDDGSYNVMRSGSVPFELEIDAPLPYPAKGGNLPIYFDMAVGFSGVTFKSTSTELGTLINLNDNGGDATSCMNRFFSSATVTRPGTTAYFRLPEWNKSLNEGDLLELYPTQFHTPAVVSVVTALEESNLLIKLETELYTNTVSYSFSQGTPVPFARIRNNQFNNYGTLQQDIESWLSGSMNQDQFFNELRRLLNPLAMSPNPTADQTSSALTQLGILDAAVASLDAILAAYYARKVPEVDTLLSTLLEKGADRARDILLECQFSTYFGLNVDTVSYAGTVQAALKDVNREDLPVRKDNRTGRRSGKEALIASYEEKDFSYDTSDLDPAQEIDIPAGTTY